MLKHYCSIYQSARSRMLRQGIRIWANCCSRLPKQQRKRALHWSNGDWTLKIMVCDVWKRITLRNSARRTGIRANGINPLQTTRHIPLSAIKRCGLHMKYSCVSRQISTDISSASNCFFLVVRRSGFKSFFFILMIPPWLVKLYTSFQHLLYSLTNMKNFLDGLLMAL